MKVELVAVGTSLGGLNALRILLKGLPGDFNLPLVLVQHRGRDSSETLPRLLQTCTTLPLLEAEDKMAIEPGHIYLAPANYHLLVEDHHFALTTDPPVEFARPSINVLFDTAADSCGPHLLGVILTGANRDGAQGAARIKARGGRLLVQDPATAECKVMPQATLDATSVDWVLPLAEIPTFLASINNKQSVMAE